MKALESKEEENDRQWLRIQELEKNNKELQELVDLIDEKKLSFSDRSKFSDELRQVIMKLHSLNLSTRSICPAIRTVVEGLVGYKIEKLPSYGTVNKLMYEAKCLALLNAGRESLRDKSNKKPSNFLLSYGTSKLKKHYNITIISTSDGVKTIGLQLFPTEYSETLIRVTEKSFQEVASIMSRVDGRDEAECLKDLLLFIKGTMSDRCEVMKKFNRLFEEYRNRVLENSVLSDEEKLKWKKLENRFCFLHIIINFGDDSCKNGLTHFDECTLEEEAFALLQKRSQSSTYNAIYAAARLLHQQGSDAFGKSSLFEAFIDNEDVEKNQEDVNVGASGKSRKGTQVLAKKSGFEKEDGNRAHITYTNSAAL